MNFSQSKALLNRAYRVIPSATQTFSKGPTQWIRGVSPHYLVRGEGAWVWDADGNKFLDYLMALGPIVLGYGNSYVNDAIIQQVKEGVCFSQMHPLEVEVAELLVDRIPCAEMVRFGKTGSDATTAAVRVARAYTNRERVIYCGYHGWHDWYIGTTTRNSGVPVAVQNLTSSFTYNDIDSLEVIFKQYPDEVACVIMEAVGVEMPQSNFLANVKELTQQYGALLIFDEIINGFRIAPGGAQELENVMPDLACFGKSIANGMPLSAVVGSREIMEIFDDIFFSGTFGGEAASLAACKATLEYIEKHSALEKNWDYGRKLTTKIKQLIKQHGLHNELKLVGYDVRSILTFPHKDEHENRLRRSYFMQECHKRGLLFFGVHLPTFAHREGEMDFTFKVYEEVFELFSYAVKKNNSLDIMNLMEGPIVEPIFRQP